MKNQNVTPKLMICKGKIKNVMLNFLCRIKFSNEKKKSRKPKNKKKKTRYFIPSKYRFDTTFRGRPI